MTSNKSFADWGDVFHDQVLAAKIPDRLLHHATTFNIKGESFRLPEQKKARLLGRRSVTTAEEVRADASEEVRADASTRARQPDNVIGEKGTSHIGDLLTANFGLDTSRTDLSQPRLSRLQGSRSSP